MYDLFHRRRDWCMWVSEVPVGRRRYSTDLTIISQRDPYLEHIEKQELATELVFLDKSLELVVPR